jgi:hypothetical protein
MADDQLDAITALPPITLRQLHTIVGALQVSLVRYPLLLQLQRFEETPALEHDDLRDLRDTLAELFEEMKPKPPTPLPDDKPPQRPRRFASSRHRTSFRRNRD